VSRAKLIVSVPLPAGLRRFIQDKSEELEISMAGICRDVITEWAVKNGYGQSIGGLRGIICKKCGFVTHTTNKQGIPPCAYCKGILDA